MADDRRIQLPTKFEVNNFFEDVVWFVAHGLIEEETAADVIQNIFVSQVDTLRESFATRVVEDSDLPEQIKAFVDDLRAQGATVSVTGKLD